MARVRQQVFAEIAPFGAMLSSVVRADIDAAGAAQRGRGGTLCCECV
jgi:hypothetical protein